MNLRTLFLSAGLAAAALPLAGQSVILNNPGPGGPFVIRNATIYPVTSAPIPAGSIVIADGRITAVGATVPVPDGATIIDGTGLSVYPGMIDSGSSIGLTEISSVAGTRDTQELGDLNPNAQAAVAINPHSNVIPVTRINGITTVLSEPGGGLISGQSALIQLSGWTPPEMVLKSPAGMHINFPRIRTGSFSAQPQDEEAEKRARKQYTSQLEKLRDTFRDAKAYEKALAAPRRTSPQQRLEQDPILHALVPVIRGEVPLVIFANLEADIREAIKFSDEVGIRMILSGGQEVQTAIPELRAKNIPVLLGPIWTLPGKEDDPYDLLFSNAAALHQAGVKFSIRTGGAHNARHLPYQAAACAAFGLPKEEALRAVTINAAEIFGVADRIGSLEAGKIANVIVTDGDPLEIRTNLVRLFIGGEDIPLDSYHTLQYEKFQRRP
ncbi:MAG TPA: amidohydrolase family protein [Thermoanaerobaculia bacterium]|nr:amidohydrolase family protein [Thermoanaerobaculia bacterium]